LMFTEDPTLTEDISNGTSATTALTKDGGSTEEESHTQNNQLPQVSDSKSDPEWLTTDPSSGTSTSDQVNSDLESEITTQPTGTNGGPSIEELNLSEPGTEETTPLPTKRDTDTELVLPLPSDHGLVITP
jgi:hypothetical protein